MFNDIPIGPVTIHMYGLMIALGFLSAYYLCVYRGRRRGLSEDILWGILCCAIVGGLIGTRLLYYIVELPAIFKDPSILWDFKNGYVVYGGIIGGVLAGFLYCRKKKVSFLKYFETDAWYGITFRNSKFAPNNVKLIPTQLISSAGDFLICGILLFYAARNPRDGRVASAYLVLYGIGRFAVEFLRNDYRGSIGWMSTSQIISIGIVVGGALLYMLFPKFLEKEPECGQETK